MITCHKDFTIVVNAPIPTNGTITAGTNERVDSQSSTLVFSVVPNAPPFGPPLTVGTFGIYIDGARIATVNATGLPTNYTLGPLVAGVHILRVHYDGFGPYQPCDLLFGGIPPTTPNIIVQPTFLYSADGAAMYNAHSTDTINEKMVIAFPVNPTGGPPNMHAWVSLASAQWPPNLMVFNIDLSELDVVNNIQWTVGDVVYNKVITPNPTWFPNYLGAFPYVSGGGPFTPPAFLHITSTP